MGRAKVSHADREVADELHATTVADNKVPPGGLVGVVGQAGVGGAGLPPLVGHSSHIDPSTFLNEVGQHWKVGHQKGGAFGPELGIFMASLYQVTCPAGFPGRVVTTSEPVEDVEVN